MSCARLYWRQLYFNQICSASRALKTLKIKKRRWSCRKRIFPWEAKVAVTGWSFEKFKDHWRITLFFSSDFRCMTAACNSDSRLSRKTPFMMASSTDYLSIHGSFLERQESLLQVAMRRRERGRLDTILPREILFTPGPLEGGPG